MSNIKHQINKNIGIFVTLNKAILVWIDSNRITVESIISSTENHFSTSGDCKTNGTSVSQSISKEQKARHHIHDFYRSIIRQINNADNIFIFGPAEAKHELAKEINKIKSEKYKVIAVETSDILTGKQIVVKAKSFFLKSNIKIM